MKRELRRVWVCRMPLQSRSWNQVAYTCIASSPHHRDYRCGYRWRLDLADAEITTQQAAAINTVLRGAG